MVVEIANDETTTEAVKLANEVTAVTAAVLGNHWTLFWPFSAAYLVVLEIANDDTTAETVKLANEVTAVLRDCLRNIVIGIQQGEQECLRQSQRFGALGLVMVVPWNNEKNKNYGKKTNVFLLGLGLGVPEPCSIWVQSHMTKFLLISSEFRSPAYQIVCAKV